MECFNTYLPSPLLSPYILYYWMLDTSIGVEERTIPFGHVQLIFHRESPIYLTTHQKFQPKAFISGMSNSYVDLQTVEKVKMVVVAFRPEGARAFLRIPLHLFHNSNISVDELEDKDLNNLCRDVCTEPDNLTCIHMIENFFINRLKSFDHYNMNRILPSIRFINSGNNLSISALPETACLSHKQFNRVFTEYIGSTPKEFYRIIRFQRALFILQNNPSTNLTQLAYEAGYFDQSHLIKDFKQFSGYTPGEFLSICSPSSDYFSHL